MANKSSGVHSQKHQPKSHHDKSHASLQNNIGLAHMNATQHANVLNASQSNNMMGGNAATAGVLQPPDIYAGRQIAPNQKFSRPDAMDAVKNNNASSIVNDHIHQQQQPPDLTGGNTTPNNTSTDLKQHTSPPAEFSSMGVYTPDSTTNSVHSLHPAQYELDVTQLGLESPASIASDIASQNSVENVRPPSVVSHPQINQFADCSLQVQLLLSISMRQNRFLLLIFALRFG